MDIASLTQLVTTTPILSEAERTYWLEHLPTMKPEQCVELEQILNAPIELPLGSVITTILHSFVGQQA